MEKAREYTDLILYDVKIMDRVKHVKFTGVSNDLILENAVRIIDEGIPIAVTVPVIPSYNDHERNIRAVAKFLSKHGIIQVRLLPYHRLGKQKYEALGMKYALENVLPLDEKQLRKVERNLEMYGLNTV